MGMRKRSTSRADMPDVAGSKYTVFEESKNGAYSGYEISTSMREVRYRHAELAWVWKWQSV